MAGKMRVRDPAFSEGWGQIVTPLLIETPGGKQKLNCASAKGPELQKNEKALSAMPGYRTFSRLKNYRTINY